MPLVALAIIGGLGIVVGAMALFAVSQGESIARRRGEITSIRPAGDDRTKVCLRDTVDAGSTYGTREPQDSVCAAGQLEGIQASVGLCVVMQTEGETNHLRLEQAEGC